MVTPHTFTSPTAETFASPFRMRLAFTPRELVERCETRRIGRRMAHYQIWRRRSHHLLGVRNVDEDGKPCARVAEPPFVVSRT